MTVGMSNLNSKVNIYKLAEVNLIQHPPQILVSCVQHHTPTMAELSLACRNFQSASAFEKLPQEVHDLIFQHVRFPENKSVPC